MVWGLFCFLAYDYYYYFFFFFFFSLSCDLLIVVFVVLFEYVGVLGVALFHNTILTHLYCIRSLLNINHSRKGLTCTLFGQRN